MKEAPLLKEHDLRIKYLAIGLLLITIGVIFIRVAFFKKNFSSGKENNFWISLMEIFFYMIAVGVLYILSGFKII